jgi:asparagine synthase (glutamine-hydrolysing)
MCGIFGFIGKDSIDVDFRNKLIQEGTKMKHRGPDNTKELMLDTMFLMFHRLCINDLSDKGNQPMRLEQFPNVILLCNGEIFNYHDLMSEHKFQVYSKSDCEIIIHMYMKYGIEETLRRLNGDYAFVLIDLEKNKKYMARDPFGIRSLYVGKTEKGEIVFGSELKSLTELCCDASQFEPGCYVDLNDMNHPKRFYEYVYTETNDDYDTCLQKIRTRLEDAVKRRLITDRPIGCLLSGGLDSSIIAAILTKHIKETNGNKLKTFSVGLKGSVDLEYAKTVAEYLNTEHHELILEKDEMFDSIGDVIYHIESYDTTTVRASTPMYLLTKYIKENFDIKVLFSGEGSDEASGSYLYFRNAPNKQSFYEETVRLLKDLKYFDVLRGEKSIASWGLEARVPFLDKEFIEYYMSIEPGLKIPKKWNGVEKYLLRVAFEEYLPKDIVWRTKEAFSDGVSSKTESWYSIIQRKVNERITDETFKEHVKKYVHNKPMLKESLYYREIFSKKYQSFEKTIPYLWLPKWSGDVNDPSARILNCYT